MSTGNRPSEFALKASAALRPFLDQLAIGNNGGATTGRCADARRDGESRDGALVFDMRSEIADFSVNVPAASGRRAIAVKDPSGAPRSRERCRDLKPIS
jgi:hypothetical protein